jgi:competence protein ComEC
VFGKAIVYLPKNTSTLLLLPGDKLEISSKWNSLKPPKNPGQFNYKNYLKFHEIEWVNYVRDDQYKLCGSNFYNIKRYSVIARNICIDLFKKSSLKNQNLAIASALTFGYKDELDSSTKHAFSSTGAMHVLAVSGLHVGISFSNHTIYIRYFPFIV